ncbi:MAG: hypothetical protein RIR34_552 [Actinomycetota bacterium]|jgi:hypothetical protein
MITIDWNHLFLVAFAALVGSAAVVITFSLGIRLLVNADSIKPKAASGNPKALRSEAVNRAGAYVMFALSFAAVIYGVLLIIPGVIPSIK